MENPTVGNWINLIGLLSVWHIKPSFQSSDHSVYAHQTFSEFYISQKRETNTAVFKMKAGYDDSIYLFRFILFNK